MNKLKVLDLFSGIGGFSLGLERTGGFETVAFCEIEEFPRKVLKKHWPEIKIYEDVTKLTGKQVGTVNLICGGFPCQDVSAAGNKKELEKILELVFLEKCLDLPMNVVDRSSYLKMLECFYQDHKKNQADGFSDSSHPWSRSGILANGYVLPLPALARRTSETGCGLLPTPTKHNSKEGAYPSEYMRNTPTLATHAGGKINPEWTEWLMGFPHNWTDLDA